MQQGPVLAINNLQRMMSHLSTLTKDDQEVFIDTFAGAALNFLTAEELEKTIAATTFTMEMMAAAKAQMSEPVAPKVQ